MTTKAQIFVSQVRDMKWGRAYALRVLGALDAVKTGTFQANTFYRLPDGSRVCITPKGGETLYRAMPSL